VLRQRLVAVLVLVLLEAVLVLVLLEAEAVDSRTAAVALLLAAEREFLPPPLSFVSFPFRFLPFLLLPWFSFLLSPSFYLFPLSPLFFPFFLRPFSSSSVLFPPSVLLRLPPSLLLCWLLFIGPSECLCTVEHGEQPAGRPWGTTAKARPPLLGFLVGARWVVGHCVRSVGSRRESGRQNSN
jgi:hypothetical protein